MGERGERVVYIWGDPVMPARSAGGSASQTPMRCRIAATYREDGDVEAQLPLLSTLLGHVEPSTTYWYFGAAPQLLSLAAERLERTWEEQS